MADSAQQLQRLYLAGFELRTFDRYPNAIGIVRGEFLALFQAGPLGLSMIGLPGRRMGDLMGVQVERDGAKFFQAKSEVVPATDEMLAGLRDFRRDLDEILSTDMS